MTRTKLEWAEYLAGRGLRIVPLHHTKADGSCTCGRPNRPADPDDRVKGVEYCGSPGKHPNVNAWETVATTDVDLIRDWFKNDPAMNYGCVAGENGFILDIDIKDSDGYSTAARLLGIPTSQIDQVTFAVKTPSGGEHLYFSADKVYSNTVKTALGDGLDNRSGNGFVVGPGSVLHIAEEFVPDNFIPVSYEVVNEKAFEPLPDAIKGRMREAMERSENAAQSMSDTTMDAEGNIKAARTMLKHRKPAIEGQGGDHHTLVTALQVRDYNISEENCLEILTEEGGWNDRCEPPWDLDELKRKVENAYKYNLKQMGNKAAALLDAFDEDVSEVGDFPAGFFDGTMKEEPVEGEKEKRKFMFYDGSAVLALNRQYDFIVDQWLPAKNYTIVLGARGSGKTTVIMDAMCYIASDLPWHGSDVDPGWYFVYVAGEDFEGVKERYEAWCFEHQSECKFNETTKRWELKDPTRVQFVDMPVDLMDDEEVTQFSNAVVALAKKLREKGIVKIAFVIDTWQRMTSTAHGGQSSDESMQKALNNLERLADNFHGPCLIAAHPPKANATTMAGSGIIENRSDAVWTVTNNGGVRTVEVTRIKGAVEGQYKGVLFHNVEIAGFDKFGRIRKSVALRNHNSSVGNDTGKIAVTAEGHKRSQDMLELVRDMIARKQMYCDLYEGDMTHARIAEISMELLENQNEIRAKSKFKNDMGKRDSAIKLEWLEKFRALGFRDEEIRRKPGRKPIKDHPVYMAMENLAKTYKGRLELNKTGTGLLWQKIRANHYVKFGALDMMAMDAATEGETVDPETGEIIQNEEDFGEI